MHNMRKPEEENARNKLEIRKIQQDMIVYMKKLDEVMISLDEAKKGRQV